MTDFLPLELWNEILSSADLNAVDRFACALTCPWLWRAFGSVRRKCGANWRGEVLATGSTTHFLWLQRERFHRFPKGRKYFEIGSLFRPLARIALKGVVQFFGDEVAIGLRKLSNTLDQRTWLQTVFGRSRWAHPRFLENLLEAVLIPHCLLPQYYDLMNCHWHRLDIKLAENWQYRLKDQFREAAHILSIPTLESLVDLWGLREHWAFYVVKYAARTIPASLEGQAFLIQVYREMVAGGRPVVSEMASDMARRMVKQNPSLLDGFIEAGILEKAQDHLFLRGFGGLPDMDVFFIQPFYSSVTK